MTAIEDARAFVEQSHIGKVTARELDRAILMLRDLVAEHERLQASYLRLVERQAQTQIDRDSARCEAALLHGAIAEACAAMSASPRHPGKWLAILQPHLAADRSESSG